MRRRFVEELGWFGEKAFVELANFISDPNEDVAEAARTQITDAFQEIDSDAEKAALFSLMAKAVSDDDLLETFADELTTMDEILALQTIVDTMSDGTPKAKKAVKAAYEQITDEKWKDVDSAETWLADNYDGDDDDSDAAKDAAELEEDVAETSTRKTKKTEKAKSDANDKKSTSRTASRSNRRSGSVADTTVAEGGDEIAEGEAEAAEEGEGEADGEDAELDEDGFGDEDGDEGSDEGDGEVDEDGNPVDAPPAPVLVD